MFFSGIWQESPVSIAASTKESIQPEALLCQSSRFLKRDPSVVLLYLVILDAMRVTSTRAPPQETIPQHSS